VSYILDALTKAAQQRDRQVPVVQRLLSPAPRARSLWSQVSGRILLALAVNAVLLAALLVWWLLPVSTQAPTEPIAAMAPAPAPASPPRPLVKLEPLPAPVTTVEKPTAPAPDTRADLAAAPPRPSAAPPPAPAAPSASTSAVPAAPSTPPAAPAGASALPQPAPSKASVPRAAPAPRIGTPGIQPTPAQAGPAMARSAPPPESASLRVEALIYADTPAERMVFINGRRYREGDSIDGRLRVEEIREEGVELSDQGRRFMLRVSR